LIWIFEKSVSNSINLFQDDWVVFEGANLMLKLAELEYSEAI